jgi:hypothetical protein
MRMRFSEFFLIPFEADIRTYLPSKLQSLPVTSFELAVYNNHAI